MKEKESVQSEEQQLRPHAPAPETVDQTKSAVSAEQVRAMEEAAPKPHTGEIHREHEKHTRKEKEENNKHHSKK